MRTFANDRFGRLYEHAEFSDPPPGSFTQYPNVFGQPQAASPEFTHTGFERLYARSLWIARAAQDVLPEGSGDSTHDHLLQTFSAPCDRNPTVGLTKYWCGHNPNGEYIYPSQVTPASDCEQCTAKEEVRVGEELEMGASCDSTGVCSSRLQATQLQLDTARSKHEPISTTFGFFGCTLESPFECCDAEDDQPCTAITSCGSTPPVYNLRSPFEAFVNAGISMFVGDTNRNSDSWCMTLHNQRSSGLEKGVYVHSHVFGGAFESHHIPAEEAAELKLCASPCDDYCARAMSCGECAAIPRCGWCESKQECMHEGSHSTAPSFPVGEPAYGECPDTSRMISDDACCPTSSCAVHTTCSDCTSTPGCGWCAEAQRCMSGLYETGSTCAADLAGVSPRCAASFLPSRGFAISGLSSDATCAALDQRSIVLATNAGDPSHLLYSDDFTDGIFGWISVDMADASVFSSWSHDSYYRRLRQRSSIGRNAADDDAEGTWAYLDYGVVHQWDDYIVEFTMAQDQLDSVGGLAFRFLDRDNFYQVDFSSLHSTKSCTPQRRRYRRLRRRRNGRFTTLAEDTTAGFPRNGVPQRVRVQVHDQPEGTFIAVWLNDQLLWHVTDSSGDRIRVGTIAASTVSSPSIGFDSFFVWTKPFVADMHTWYSFDLWRGRYLELPFSTIADLVSSGKTIAALHATMESLADEPDTAHYVWSTELFSLQDVVAPEPAVASSYFYGFQSESHTRLGLTSVLPLFANPASPQPVQLNFDSFFFTAHRASEAQEHTSWRIRFEPVELHPINAPGTVAASSTPGGAWYANFRVNSPVDRIKFTFATAPRAVPASVSYLVRREQPPTRADFDALVPDLGPRADGTDSYAPVELEISSVSAGDHFFVAALADDFTQFAFDLSVQLAEPFIDNINPVSGPTTGGYNLIIRGTNLGTQGSVQLGTTLCAPISWSPSEVQCTVAPGQGLVNDVQVFSSGQASNVVPFAFLAPTIDAVAPSSAPTGSSSELLLSIQGANFGERSDQRSVLLLLNGAPAPGVLCEQTNPQSLLRHSSIECIVPEGTGADVALELNVAGQRVRVGQVFGYDPPVIFSVEPAQLPAAATQPITINGRNFGGATALQRGLVSVSVGAQTCAIDPAHITHSRIVCTVAPLTGVGHVLAVHIDDQHAVAVVDVAPPVITLTEPPTAPTVGGTVLTLHGKNFGNDTAQPVITIEGKPCPLLEVATGDLDTRRTCVLQAGYNVAASLAVSITVDGQPSRQTRAFAYASPEVERVLPDTVPAAGSVPVTLQGSNFGPPGVPQVWIGDQQCELISSNHSHIECLSPAGVGFQSLTVHVGVSSVTLASAFGYDRPTISRLVVRDSLPSAIPALGGVTLTLFGANFGSDPDQVAVRVGGFDCPLIVQTEVFNDTTAVCRVPSGSAATVQVVIRVASVVSSFVYAGYAAPHVTTFQPVRGPTLHVDNSSRTLLTIAGTNFGEPPDDVVVTLGDDRPCELVQHTDTELVCAVPPGEGVNLNLEVSRESRQVTVQEPTFSYNPPFIARVHPKLVDAGSSALVTIIGQELGTLGDGTFSLAVRECSVVDETSATFSGLWTLRTTSASGAADAIYGTTFRAATQSVAGASSAEFVVPVYEEGTHEVFIAFPAYEFATHTVEVVINHADGNSTSHIDQRRALVSDDAEGAEGSDATAVVVETSTATMFAAASSFSRNGDSLQDKWYSLGHFGFMPGLATVTVRVPPLHSVGASLEGIVDAVRVCKSEGTPVSVFEVRQLDSLSNVTAHVYGPRAQELVFIAPAKVGSAFDIDLRVGSRRAAYDGPMFGYNPPMMTSVSGCPLDSFPGTSLCRTDQANHLTIRGRGFGQDPSRVQIQVNGVDCASIHLTNDSFVTCTTGTFDDGGSDKPVAVTVAGQRVEKPWVGFAGPTIRTGSLHLCDEPAPAGDAPSSVVVPLAGDALCFSGRDFGLPEDDVAVLYGSPAFERSTRAQQQSTALRLPEEFTAGLDASFSSPELGIWFECLIVSMNNTHVRCRTQAGVGSGHQLLFRSGTLLSDLSADTISYPPPVLVNRTIRENPDDPKGASNLTSSTSLGSTVVVDVWNVPAQHFDPFVSVSLLPPGATLQLGRVCESPRVLGPMTDPKYDGGVFFNSSHPAHQGGVGHVMEGGQSVAVECRTLGGNGAGSRIAVAAGGTYAVRVSEDTYNYPDTTPVLLSASGCDDDHGGAATINCPTKGGVVITLHGRTFCEPDLCANAAFEIRVGLRVCVNIMLTPTNATCVLPAGSGGLDTARVTMLSRGSLSDPAPLVAYAPPVVHSVSGCSDEGSSTYGCRHDGDSLVFTISGESFGPSGARAWIGAALCSSVAHDVHKPHELLVCTVAADADYGGTARLPVTVVIDGSSPSVSGDTPTVWFSLCQPGEIVSPSASSSDSNCTACPQGRYAPFSSSSVCSACPPGAFAREEGMPQCDPCPPGTAQPLSGQDACTPCEPGSAASGTGNPTCSLCSRGSYSSRYSAGVCSRCPQGRFSSSEGATECQECPPGTKAGSSGYVSCGSCPRGTWSESGSLQCISCEPGRANAVAGRGSPCEACPIGKYQPDSGEFACLDCPLGSFCNSTAMEEPLECAAGRFAAVSALAECPECPAGKFSIAAGSLFCTECPKGSAQPSSRSLSCDECAPGRFASETGQTECDECPPGRSMASHGALVCSECEVGKSTQGESGAIECTNCAPGWFQSECAQAECEPCAQGRYSDKNGSSVCEACAAGSYTDRTQQRECMTCNEGRWAPRASTTCLDCEPGRFAPGTGLAACSPCGLGQFANESSMVRCHDCPPGQFASSTGLSTCSTCSPGYSAPLKGSFACDLCPKGHVSEAEGSAQCDKCPAGRFQAESGRSQCQICPTGRAAVIEAQASCQLCTPGRFSNATESTVCYECPKGRAQPLAGKSECRECPAGTFALEGEVQCRSCAEGTFSNVTASQLCQVCPSGKFADVASTVCSACAAGTFSASEGARYCAPCPRGRATARVGASRCDACELGHFAGFDQSSSCSLCEPGRFSSTQGAEECTLCPLGRFSNSSGSIQCEACRLGSSQPAPGQTQCTPCEPGFYQELLGQAKCAPCPVGTATALNGSSECQSCEKGEYQNALGSSRCKLCQPGTFSSGQRQFECRECEQGHVSAVAGAERCELCPPGKHQEDQGKSVCSDCDAGFESSANGIECKRCSSQTFAPTPGTASCFACPFGQDSSQSRTFCQCDVGLYLGQEAGGSATQTNFSCLQCHEGALCEAEGVVFESLETRPGWWRASESSTTFYRCLVADHCLGGHESRCDTNREGPLCALCSAGSQETSIGTCASCSSNDASNYAVIVSIMLAMGTGLIVMYGVLIYTDRGLLRLIKRKHERRVKMLKERDGMFKGGFDELAEAVEPDFIRTEDFRPVGKPNMTYKLKILVGFFQIATNLTFALDMPWPRTFHKFIAVFNLFNVDFVQWSSVSCVTQIDFYAKLVMATVVPLIILMLIMLCYTLPHFWQHRRGLRFCCWSAAPDPYKEDMLARERTMTKTWKLLLFTAFLVYPYVSSRILRMYVCREVEDTHYLQADFKLECFDERWRSYVPYSLLSMLVYPFGIPCFFFLMLFFNRHDFRRPLVRAQLGFLYDGYSPATWWFELVDVFHKLVLTSLLGFFPVDLQMPVGMTVSGGYAVIILLSDPYWRKGDLRLHLFAQTEILLIILAGYIFFKTDTRDLSDLDDVVMSVALIVVCTAFIIIFAIQALNIGRKMFILWRKKRDKEAGIGSRLLLRRHPLQNRGPADKDGEEEEETQAEEEPQQQEQEEIDDEQAEELLEEYTTYNAVQDFHSAVQLHELHPRTSISSQALMYRNPLRTLVGANGSAGRDTTESQSRVNLLKKVNEDDIGSDGSSGDEHLIAAATVKDSSSSNSGTRQSSPSPTPSVEQDDEGARSPLVQSPNVRRSLAAKRPSVPSMSIEEKRGSVAPPPQEAGRGSIVPPPPEAGRGSIVPPPPEEPRGSIVPPPPEAARGSIAPLPEEDAEDAAVPADGDAAVQTEAEAAVQGEEDAASDSPSSTDSID